MALGTFAGPVVGFVVGDARICAANVTDTLPNASNTTTFLETNLEHEVYADDGNHALPGKGEGARPIASGKPTTSASFSLRPQQPGRPNRSATFLATSNASDGTEYGATPPYIPMGAWPVIGDPSYTATGYQNPRNVVTPAGTHLQVMEKTTGTDGVVVLRRASTSSVFTTAATLWTTTTAFNANVHATPIIWYTYSTNTNGYIVFCATLEVTSTNTQTLRVDLSYDDGVTWTFSHYSNLVLSVSAIYYELQGIYLDLTSLQYVMAVRKNDGGTYTIRTYVSDDQVIWQYMSGGDIADGRIARLAYNCGDTGYMVVIDGSNVMSSYLHVHGDGEWTLTKATIGGGVASTSNLGFILTDSGVLLVYFRPNGSTSILYVMASSNGGYDWGALVFPDGASNYPYDDNVTTTALTDDSGGLSEGLIVNDAFWGDGAIWLVGHMTAGGAALYSVVEIACGGIGNIQLGYPTDSTYNAFYPGGTTTYPSTKVWTFTGASVESGTTDSASRTVYQISNANAIGYNTYNFAACGVHVIVGPDSTGGSTASQAFVIQVSDTVGGNNVIAEVRVNADTGALQVYDMVGGANKGTAGSYDATLPVEVIIAVDIATSVVSAYYKSVLAYMWTEMARDIAIGSAAGTSDAPIVGKVIATTAKVHILFQRPFNHMDGLSDSFTRFPLGIPASILPSRFPPGDMWLRWKGGDLIKGNVWTARTCSRTPIARMFPGTAAGDSPALQYKGPAGSAGATYRATFDFGLNYKSKLSTGMVGLELHNAPGVVTMRLLRWDGSAQQVILSSTNRWQPFGAAGAVGFARGSASSYLFTPNATNGTPVRIGADKLKGMWVYLASGANEIAGTILRNDEMVFSSASTQIGGGFELDPDTVVEVSGGGAFAALTTATTTGTVYLYPPDVIAIGRQTGEATQHYMLEYTLAPGATVPKAGIFTAGAAYILARPERAGGSMRWISPGELSEIGAGGFKVAKRKYSKVRRAYEFPFEGLVCYGGAIYGSGGSTSAMNALSVNGSTPMAYVDGNLRTLEDIFAQTAGQRPVGMFMGDLTDDPGAVTQVYRGEQTLFGWLGDSFDIVASAGRIRPTSDGTNNNRQGGTLAIVEAV